MGKGSNSRGLRRYNERALLTALRKAGQCSKADLARASNLTPQAVTRIIDELDAMGLVIPKGRRLGGKGKPSLLYALNPAGAYSIGIKVGRLDVELSLTDFSGRSLGRIAYEFEFPEPTFLLEKIEIGISELTSILTQEQTGKLMGVGIAMPWFMGEWSEDFGFSEKLAKQWQEINFYEALARRIDLEIFLENDCSAAAVAELQFGRGADIATFLYVFLDTFIGGGLVLEGELEPGVHGNSAAIASMPVPESKLDSRIPLNGPFETLVNRASLFVLLRHLACHDIGIERISELASIMDEARPLVQEWLDDCADALVFAMLSAVGVLDLEAIIIDGQLPRFLIDELVDVVSRRIHKIAPHGVFEPEILAGSCGPDAIVLGGAMLPFYSHFAPDKAVLLTGGVPERVLLRS